ncbi:MAG TPA: hypothetical protein VLG69_04465, partial [Candidatus Andersenbacteria bacterium]|nr:hypothetical protein [Candidatus Andersenbacteria bacterium]
VLRISREDPNQALDANLFADELIDRGDLVASFSADEPRLGEEQRHFVGALFRQFRLRSIEGPLYSLTFSFLEDPYILHFHLDTKEGKRGEAETEQSNFD